MSRYCGRTMRVLRVLEHYYDELREGLCEAENAVLLEGANCDSSQLGSRRCDRGCLHFWKESWLEPAAGPATLPAGDSPSVTGRERIPRRAAVRESGTERPAPGALRVGTAVRVRDESAIAATLDDHGVCEGVPFIREHMARHCGQIFIVGKSVRQFFDEKADYMIRLPQGYALEGVICDGRQSGDEPDCDRGCALVWHRAWLEPCVWKVRTTDVSDDTVSDSSA